MGIQKTAPVNWNPFTPGYFDDPYKHLLDCQETHPVQMGASVSNYVVLFKHKHVKEVLKSPYINTSNLSMFFVSKEPVIFKNTGGCPFLSKSTKKWLMYLDGEEHNVASYFLGKALDRFRYETVVEAAVDMVLDEFKKREGKEIDLVEIAALFPVLIINQMLGMPSGIPNSRLQDVAHSLAHSQDLFLSKQMYIDINNDMEWIYLLFSELYDKKKNNPDHSLISFLTAINEEEQLGFSKDEIISILMVVFLGAIETSKDTISMVFLELLKNNHLIRLIKNNSRIENNILLEEFLRFSSPLQYTIRETTQDWEIDNMFVPAKSRLLLCLAAANRDKTVFDNPNEIVPGRNYNPHLSFGLGKHSCIGAKLARIELRQFLPKIAPVVEAFDFHPDHPPEWQRGIMMRGLKHLWVVKK